MSKKLDHKFWAKYFQVYDVLNMVIPYQELLGTIVKELDAKKGDFILDAGCGTGNLAVKLSGKGAKVFGIDYSKEALEIAKKKKIKNFEMMQHDLTKKLPFPDNHFDKIASNNVIYALPESCRKGVFVELRRVLKPRGVVVVSNPHPQSRPSEIYKKHVLLSINVKGLWKTLVDVLIMIPDTVRVFRYNKKIMECSEYVFLSSEDKISLLTSSEFEVLKTKEVYVNQGILVTGLKNGS